MKKSLAASLMFSLFAVVVTVLHYITPSGTQGAHRAFLSLEQRVSLLADRQDKSNIKLSALMDAVNNFRTALTAIQQSLLASSALVSTKTIPEVIPQDSDTSVEIVPSSTQADSDLQIHPKVISSKQLKDLLNDDLLNPKKVVPDRITKAKIHLELRRAQAQLSVISSEIDLELFSAMKDLSERGEFITYQPGQPPPTPNDPSILSVAEGVGSDIRMYFLDLEKFPNVFALRDKRAIVANEAISKITGLFDEAH